MRHIRRSLHACFVVRCPIFRTVGYRRDDRIAHRRARSLAARALRRLAARRIRRAARYVACGRNFKIILLVLELQKHELVRGE